MSVFVVCFLLLLALFVCLFACLPFCFALFCFVFYLKTNTHKADKRNKFTTAKRRTS